MLSIKRLYCFSTATLLFLLLIKNAIATKTRPPDIRRVLIITATSNANNEAFQRFNNSINSFDLNLILLETKKHNKLNEEIASDFNSLQKADISRNKINLFKKALETYKREQDLLILWVENPERFIVNGESKRIEKIFRDVVGNSKSRILLPMSNKTETASETLIGLANYLWDYLVERENYNGLSSKVELKPDKLSVTFDKRDQLFQDIDSILGNDTDVEMKLKLEFNTEKSTVTLKNKMQETEPLLVFASNQNSRSQIALNSLGNYLGRAWSPSAGCRDCNKSTIQLPSVVANHDGHHDYSKLDTKQFPLVLIGLFVEQPTPFFEDFLESVILLNYPRDRIHLFIHNLVEEYHDRQLEEFLIRFGKRYASVELLKRNDSEISKTEHKARKYAIDKCLSLKCEYYLSLDSIARLDEQDSLRILIEADKTIVAPLLVRTGKLWSNFWGALNPIGYYLRSFDYVEIVKRERLGMWNVAHIAHAYLIKMSSFLNEIPLNKENIYHNRRFPARKPIYAFSENLRKSNVFMHLLNTPLDFGHLVDPSNYNTTLKHPDFHQLKQNMLDWEQRYLHDNYSRVLEDDFKLEEPCQDVFWFPIVNDLFCQHMIEIMEHYGRWSGGTNDDPRLEGGYESVPTRDIHLKQVGLHQMWLTFLKEYVMPVQLKQYIGYEHDPPRADLAFVVRYHPAEQASLQPHHDSSTYTMNIALNKPNIDYQGGGCKFVRYNCSVTDSRRGWALIHPGRLTHYHEGLTVTNGTRYILVTFIDP